MAKETLHKKKNNGNFWIILCFERRSQSSPISYSVRLFLFLFHEIFLYNIFVKPVSIFKDPLSSAEVVGKFCIFFVLLYFLVFFMFSNLKL